MATSTPRPLLKAPELQRWLNVSEWWLRERLIEDPDFPHSDIALAKSSKRDLRFDVELVAKHLGLPVPPIEVTNPPAEEAAPIAA
jgi:hypothetical protein